MEFSFFKEIMEDNRGLKRLSLNLWGEPLLHRDIFKMVALAKSLNTETVMFTTNGTLLNKTNISRIIDSGLDLIEISMDGLGTTYQKIRGYKYSALERNITVFLEEIERQRSKLKVGLVTVIFDETKGEIKEFSSRWNGAVDHIKYQPMVTFNKKREMKFCPEFFGKYDGRLIVLWNGKVILCCQDVEGALELGDAHNIRIKDIWNGNTLNNLRDQVKIGILPQICTTCTEYEHEGASKRYNFIT